MRTRLKRDIFTKPKSLQTFTIQLFFLFFAFFLLKNNVCDFDWAKKGCIKISILVKLQKKVIFGAMQNNEMQLTPQALSTSILETFQKLEWFVEKKLLVFYH